MYWEWSRQHGVCVMWYYILGTWKLHWRNHELKRLLINFTLITENPQQKYYWLAIIDKLKKKTKEAIVHSNGFKSLEDYIKIAETLRLPWKPIRVQAIYFVLLCPKPLLLSSPFEKKSQKYVSHNKVKAIALATLWISHRSTWSPFCSDHVSFWAVIEIDWLDFTQGSQISSLNQQKASGSVTLAKKFFFFLLYYIRFEIVNDFITARIPKEWEGNLFTRVCLFVHAGGEGGSEYPITGQDRGVPPSQVRMGEGVTHPADWGGVPISGQWGGGYLHWVNWGVPHPRSGWEGVTHPADGGLPPSGQCGGTPIQLMEGGTPTSKWRGLPPSGQCGRVPPSN